MTLPKHLADWMNAEVKARYPRQMGLPRVEAAEFISGVTALFTHLYESAPEFDEKEWKSFRIYPESAVEVAREQFDQDKAAIAALKADKDFHCTQANQLSDECQTLRAELAEAQTENAKLRAALEYIVKREDFSFAECSEAEEIWSRARKALEDGE